jgi:hypothetical protein
MNPQEHLPVLRDIAARVLPGFRHAKAQMEIAVRVLEYFERHAEHELSTGTFRQFEPPGPEQLEEIHRLRSMLNCYCRIHEPRN